MTKVTGLRRTKINEHEVRVTLYEKESHDRNFYHNQVERWCEENNLSYKEYHQMVKEIEKDFRDGKDVDLTKFYPEESNPNKTQSEREVYIEARIERDNLNKEQEHELERLNHEKNEPSR